MKSRLKIGLIGDFDPQKIAHQCIPKALEISAQAFGVYVDAIWLATTTSYISSYESPN